MFVSGDRVFPPPNDLGYTSLGSFFARQGFVTVIPDYRLAPANKFPDPVEDVRDALLYAVQNVTEGDPNNIFIMGHSAGAAHTASLVLIEPSILRSTTLQPRIKGIILSCGVYNFRDGGWAPEKILTSYFGSVEKAHVNCVYALLETASQDTLDAIPSVLMMSAEKDQPDIRLNEDQMAQLLNKRQRKEVERKLARGHNHISVNWALGSGEGEEWGYEVVEWVKLHL